jgi:hypothetical protein
MRRGRSAGQAHGVANAALRAMKLRLEVTKPASGLGSQARGSCTTRRHVGGGITDIVVWFPAPEKGLSTNQVPPAQRSWFKSAKPCLAIPVGVDRDEQATSVARSCRCARTGRRPNSAFAAAFPTSRAARREPAGVLSGVGKRRRHRTSGKWQNGPGARGRRCRTRGPS